MRYCHCMLKWKECWIRSFEALRPKSMPSREAEFPLLLEPFTPLPLRSTRSNEEAVNYG